MAFASYASGQQHTSSSENYTHARHQNTTSTEDVEQESGITRELTAWIPSIPVQLDPRATEPMKPVVIPRVDTTSSLSTPLPFIRAYSPALHPHNVSKQAFLAFLDNLAIAEAAPVPLQALDLAGTAIGFIPDQIAMATGTSLNLAAGLGTALASTLRTRTFLEKVNRDYFAPRGLRASICKNAQLPEKLGYAACDVPDLICFDSEAPLVSLRERRMRTLAPYIAPLVLDVSLPTGQSGFLDRMSAKQIERRLRKKEEKWEGEVGKRMEKEEKWAEKKKKKKKRRGSDGGSGGSGGSEGGLGSGAGEGGVWDVNGGVREDGHGGRVSGGVNGLQAVDRGVVESQSVGQSETGVDCELGERTAKADTRYEKKETKEDKKVAREEEKASRKEKKAAKEEAKVDREEEKKASRKEEKAARKNQKATREEEKKDARKIKKAAESAEKVAKEAEKRAAKEEKVVARMEFIVVEKLDVARY